jgi:hypothetical protein
MTGNVAQLGLPPLVERLLTRYESELRSIIQFRLPFSEPEHALLLVMEESLRDTHAVLAEAGAKALQETDILCLRESEICQLFYPNPHAPATFATPYWIREAGEVLWGRDLRNKVLLGHPPRMLTNHLDFVRFGRNRLILSCLTEKRYRDLLTSLQRERALLMATALLEREIWRVYPATVAGQFSEAYPDSQLKENIAEAGELHARIAAAGPDLEKPLAYRSVWLFETFLRRLEGFAA